MPDESTKPRRRFVPRFSLRTLLIVVLFVASAVGLRHSWAPWTLVWRLGGHVEAISDVAWSPDGNLMLTYSRSGSPFASSKIETNETFVWDARSGTRLACILFGQDMGGYDSARFSGDSRWVVIYCAHNDSIEAIFDAHTGEPLLPGSLENPPRRVRFSPDESLLLVEYNSRAPELWDLSKREQRYVFETVGPQVDRGDFSPDGKRVAICFWRMGERAVAVFDVTTGACLNDLNVPLKWPFAFSSDGRNLVGALEEPLSEFVNQRYDSAFAGVQEGQEEQRTCVVNLESGKVVRVLNDELSQRPAFPGGSNLLFLGKTETAVRDGSTLEVKCTPTGLPCSFDAMSADGNRIVTTTPDHSALTSSWTGMFKSTDNELCFDEWDIAANRELCRVRLHMASNELFQWACYGLQDRRFIAFTTEKIVAWDAGTGANMTSLPGNGIPSPDLRRALLWKMDENLHVGDFARGEIVATLEGTTADMAPKAGFSPAGYRVLLLPGGKANEAQVWVRRREESPWGLAWLPEFWLTVVFALLLVWSLVRDVRTLRRATA